jgi:hypothetical protein
MDLISIEDFLDDVMPELPGCTEFIAMDKIRLSAIEFCRLTQVSQEAMTELDLEEGEPYVDIPTPNNSVKVYRVMWVRIPHRTLTAYRRQALVNRGANWDETGSGEWPTSFIQEKKGQIRVIPTPDRDQSESVTANVAFIPTRSATKLDAILLDDYRDAIASGALYRLLRMKKEDWYDPDSATLHMKSFASDISNARASVNKDQLMADTRVQNHAF